MKDGDLVRYKVMQDYVSKIWLWEQGLLLEFDKVQRSCLILENKTGKIVKLHCSDVQLVKVGNAKR